MAYILLGSVAAYMGSAFQPIYPYIAFLDTASDYDEAILLTSRMPI